MTAFSFLRTARYPLFLVLAACTSLVSCGDPQLVGQSVESDPELPSAHRGSPSAGGRSFPVRRTIRDQKGRSIRAEIIGRGNGTITFLRLRDRKRFDFPIGNLSIEDQQFVKGLPVLAAPEPLTGPIGSRKAEIQRLERERGEMEKSLGQRDLGEIKRRSLRRDIEKINEEIAEIRERIEWLQGSGR